MNKRVLLLICVPVFALALLGARLAENERSRLTATGGAGTGPLGSISGPPFTVAVIPDSQYLTAIFTNEWMDQIDWVIAQARKMDIKAVIHLGDLVDNSSGNALTNRQLQIAMFGLNKLRAAGIPLILAPGNHDTGGGSMPLNLAGLSAAGLTPQWFSNYANFGKGWTMGFQNPTNLFGSYLLLTNAAQPWLFTCLCWQPDKSLVLWASNIVQSRADIPAVYFEHIFVGQRPDGRISSWSDPWSVERSWLPNSVYYPPTALWREWLRTTPNVFWVASGHEPNESNSSFYSDAADDGHVVTFTLTDFQNWFATGYQGSNYMQIVTFAPAANLARVHTFSPTFTKHPLLASNMNYSFPLRTERRPALSPWQSKLAGSANQQGLALYLNFEQTHSVADLSPFAAPMVASNLFFQPTELGSSASFPGRPGVPPSLTVGIPSARSLYTDMELDQFSHLRQLTVSCWFKTTNTAWSGPPHALLTKFKDGAVGDFALIAVGNASGLGFITVNAAGQRVELSLPAPAPFNDGRWHHVCGVYDGARMGLYFDGALLGGGAQTGEIQSTGNAVCIGGSDGGQMASWEGFLDEIKILTTPWNAEMVAQEYQRISYQLKSRGVSK